MSPFFGEYYAKASPEWGATVKQHSKLAELDERVRYFRECVAGGEAFVKQSRRCIEGGWTAGPRAALGPQHRAAGERAAGRARRARDRGEPVERNVNVGAQVHADADKPLVTVADLATVWVIADVYEQELQRIHVGDSATVAIPARTDRRSRR